MRTEWGGTVSVKGDASTRISFSEGTTFSGCSREFTAERGQLPMEITFP